MIVNAGSIAGGLSGHAGPADRVQANAVELKGADNRLELRHGYSFTGNVVADGTGSTLALGGSGNASFDVGQVGGNRQYQGFEAFEKTGTSTWTLTGDGSGFAGTTTVSGGLLSINGTLGGTVSVLSGGRLGGSGTVGTTSVADGGIIAPGNSVGTLSVAGDLTFQSGSVYAVEVDGAGSSDRIVATGKATIVGGTVSVTAERGGDDGSTYDPRTTYTILTAGGGVAGTFETVLDDFAFLDASLAYDPDAVRLTLVRNDADFVSIAGSRNQRAVAESAGSLATDSTLYRALVGLGEAAAPAVFDALSGEIHASIKSGLIEDSRFVRDAVGARMRSAFSGIAVPAMPLMAYGPDGRRPAAADSAGLVAWGQAFGAWGESEGNGNAAKLDRSTGGFLTGLDGTVTENFRLGVLAGYSHSSFHADDRASSGSSDNVHLGLYGGGQWNALRLTGGLAYTWHAIETSRSVAFPGFADSLSADYDAGTFQAFGEAGYRIETSVASFEPFAGLAYVDLDTDGFGEEGGAAALSASGGTTDTTFATLGLRVSTDFTLGTMTATARGTLGWRHAFGDTVPLATQAFDGGAAFTVAGAPIAEDAAIVEAGLDLAVTDSATLGLSYAGQIASDAREHGFNARLALRF